MEEVMDLITRQANIFVTGVVDSLSLHKTLPILVNNKDVRNLTFQVLAANGVLLLGSILVFRRGLSPVLNFMMENVVSDENLPGSNITDRIMWVLYQTFWLLPVCALCYGCSVLWYQELADHTYKYVKGMPKTSSVSKTVGFVLYATLVWLFMFIQVQLLCNLGPVLVNYFIVLVNNVLKTSDNSSFYYVFLFIRQSLVYSLRSIIFAMQTGGNLLMCVLYGWYGFDPTWIAGNMHPDVRFSYIERHWAYFVGFGFPYVLIIKNTSFFVGYGIFLALFPFCIMLGSLSDFKAPYIKYQKRSVLKSNSSSGGSKGNKLSSGNLFKTTTTTSTPPSLSSNLDKNKNSEVGSGGGGDAEDADPLRVFSVAKKWTLSTLKRINKSSYEAHQKNRRTAAGTNKSATASTATSSTTGSSSNKKAGGGGGEYTVLPKGILKVGGKSKDL